MPWFKFKKTLIPAAGSALACKHAPIYLSIPQLQAICRAKLNQEDTYAGEDWEPDSSMMHCTKQM